MRAALAVIAVIGASIACLNAAVAQDRPINVPSFADTSCGAWTRSANNELARAQYTSWFRGFVAGYNSASPNNQVLRMPDDQTLALYVDKFCRDEPLAPFVGAAFKLVTEAREVPSPATAKQRK